MNGGKKFTVAGLVVPFVAAATVLVAPHSAEAVASARAGDAPVALAYQKTAVVFKTPGRYTLRYRVAPVSPNASSSATSGTRKVVKVKVTPKRAPRVVPAPSRWTKLVVRTTGSGKIVATFRNRPVDENAPTDAPSPHVSLSADEQFTQWMNSLPPVSVDRFPLSVVDMDEWKTRSEGLAEQDSGVQWKWLMSAEVKETLSAKNALLHEMRASCGLPPVPTVDGWLEATAWVDSVKWGDVFTSPYSVSDRDMYVYKNRLLYARLGFDPAPSYVDIAEFFTDDVAFQGDSSTLNVVCAPDVTGFSVYAVAEFNRYGEHLGDLFHFVAYRR